MRIFLTSPPKGEHYVDPLRLIELSGSYSGQPHVTVSKGTDLKPVMALVEQSYGFRRAKMEM